MKKLMDAECGLAGEGEASRGCTYSRSLYPLTDFFLFELYQVFLQKIDVIPEKASFGLTKAYPLTLDTEPCFWAKMKLSVYLDT